MIDLKCPRCGETVVESTAYIHRSYDELRGYGGEHGSAELKGWRCLNCGTEKSEKTECGDVE